MRVVFLEVFVIWAALVTPSLHGHLAAQSTTMVNTADISNFLEALSILESAGDRKDSMGILQTYYLDRGDHCLQGFVKLRDFSAGEYLSVLQRYPQFWKSITPIFESTLERADQLSEVIALFEQQFEKLDPVIICLSVGTLRTGGTVAGNTIYIGTEIAAADSTVITSEMGPWLQGVIGKTSGLEAMVAHEMVHVLQYKLPFRDFLRALIGKNRHLSTAVLNEGVADFISEMVSGLNINKKIHEYGKSRDEWIMTEFKKDLKANPYDYSNWLYNGGSIKDRPADLGYYVGYRMAEYWYHLHDDKDKALNELIDRSNYRKISRRFFRSLGD